MLNVWILIPAYNEEKRIGNVIDDLISNKWNNILVVNDGSKDNTAKVAQEKGAYTLSLLINRGQGAALRAGMEYLAKYELPDIIITYDADGQHHTEDLPTLIKPIQEDEADIVLGSRFLDKRSNVPAIRKIILKCGIIYTMLVSGIKLTDAHNGLRALSGKAYSTIKISHRGMEHASEIIDEIKDKNLRYKEVPVKITYSKHSLRKGQSTSNFMKLGIKFMIKKIVT